MIFPVGFATIFAVLVGNAINHGLYHSLIDATASFLPEVIKQTTAFHEVRRTEQDPGNVG